MATFKRTNAAAKKPADIVEDNSGLAYEKPEIRKVTTLSKITANPAISIIED